MRPLRSFNEFIMNGIVKRQSKDKSRANSLIKESEDAYKFLIKIVKEIGLSDKNANYIVKNSYDIIMELIRAKMLLSGYNSSGKGAHEAEVAYLRELNFSESDVQFTNQLRYFRNGIMYYGKKFDEEYAKKVLNFLKKIKNKVLQK